MYKKENRNGNQIMDATVEILEEYTERPSREFIHIVYFSISWPHLYFSPRAQVYVGKILYIKRNYSFINTINILLEIVLYS